MPERQSIAEAYPVAGLSVSGTTIQFLRGLYGYGRLHVLIPCENCIHSTATIIVMSDGNMIKNRYCSQMCNAWVGANATCSLAELPEG